MYVLRLVYLKNATAGLLVLLGLLLASRPGFAQSKILDDTTKVVYGPKTTRVIYEREARRDSLGGTLIDTTLTRWPQERFWLHDTTFQQNLGALGTATRPLLYQPNLALGARFGRNTLDRYAHDASQVPYYDSRSPYSFFRLVQSSEGEQIFEISYSRSLKKNFSVGVDYERIASNQVLATSGNQWLVEHNNFTFFGRYQSDNGRYNILANYSAMRQRTREQGGIWPTDAQQTAIATNIATGQGVLGNILFHYGTERTYLSPPAINIEDRDQVRVFQSYRLAQRGFTAYHVADVRRQYNGYNDDALPRGTAGQLLFYPIAPQEIAGPDGQVVLRRQRGVFRNLTATNDRATYRQLENTLGLLGRTDRVEYNVYGRVRNASLDEYSTATGQQRTSAAGVTPEVYVPTTRSGVGVPLRRVYGNTYLNAFVGGTAAFNYRTIYAVEVAGEYKFFDEYWLRGTVRTGPLSAELLTTSVSPTLTQQVFIGNHYVWPDTLGNVKFAGARTAKTNQLSVRFYRSLPLLAGHSLDLRGTVVNLSGYFYYNRDGLPDQLGVGDDQQLLVLYARHRFALGKFHFDNQATYTKGAGASNPALRVPELVTESRVYYQTTVFRNALFGQLGAEFTYQSSFLGYNYAPSTQQFYIQDNILPGSRLPAYGIANVFLSADIKAASIFLKGAYINQGLGGVDGYFAAPYYSGYQRRFQLGVRWRFFN